MTMMLMTNHSKYLSYKCDRFIPHGVSISDVGFDDVAEGFLDAGQQLLLDGGGPDDQRTPHRVLHRLDAGVHVGHGQHVLAHLASAGWEPDLSEIRSWLNST